ncbi:unnamed protein product [Symbiodinium sp. CCMP2592]|nr:unnamed protein product [Symbiodinium sp. CCMP2592]
MYTVSNLENTCETWRTSTSPQLQDAKDATSSALSDVAQRQGFGNCSSFLQEHGGVSYAEHQHPEFVSDLQSGTSCYATCTLNPHWAQVLLLLEQACTNWHAPSGRLTQLSRPVCGLLGQQQYFNGIIEEDFVTKVFGNGLEMPPWAGSVLKWATEHTHTWNCYPQIWSQYVEKPMERTRRVAELRIQQEREDPQSPESQMMILAATREGLIKAFTENCRSLYPILEDLDLVYHMMLAKDRAKSDLLPQILQDPIGPQVFSVYRILGKGAVSSDTVTLCVPIWLF